MDRGTAAGRRCGLAVSVAAPSVGYLAIAWCMMALVVFHG
jgi:hypothetical protein